MELSETLCGGEEGGRRQFEAWSHFASQLVFFYFLQLIHIPSVLNKLRKKVGGGGGGVGEWEGEGVWGWEGEVELCISYVCCSCHSPSVGRAATG